MWTIPNHSRENENENEAEAEEVEGKATIRGHIIIYCSIWAIKIMKKETKKTKSVAFKWPATKQCLTEWEWSARISAHKVPFLPTSLSLCMCVCVSFSLSLGRSLSYTFLFYDQVNRAQFERKWLDFTQKLKMVSTEQKENEIEIQLKKYQAILLISMVVQLIFSLFRCFFLLLIAHTFFLLLRVGYMPTWTNGSPNLLTSVWPMPQACIIVWWHVNEMYF